MWCVSSVPKPERTTRRRSALPSPFVSSRWSSSVLLATYAAAVSPGSTPVGISRPSAKTVVTVGLAVAVRVFEDDDLVVGLLARLDLRVDSELATQSRPAGSKFIWIGLASSGSAAKRLTSKPAAG